MKRMLRLPALVVPAIAIAAIALAAVAYAENIDPNNDQSQYAWGESVGWINFEPSFGPGVTVSPTKVTGYAWGESIGWISMHCDNTTYCGTVNYGITNNGYGDLSGYAWSESKGWISFSCANTSSCGTVDYGVSIDTATGEFEGFAFGESIGWINFNCSNNSTCGTVPFKVQASAVAVTDSDGDGCSDVEEAQTAVGSETLGGRRNPNLQWDFYDVNGSKKVDSADIGLVRSKFNQNFPAYDRSPGAQTWAPGPPNGIVNGIDVGLVRASFNHSCTAAP